MKLVRDRIGDIPWPDEQAKRHLGQVATDSPQYRELLWAKLREECAELVYADRCGDPATVLDEAADVYEVLRALLVANGCPAFLAEARLIDRAAFKSVQRGGFFQGRTYDGPIRPDHPTNGPSGTLSAPVAADHPVVGTGGPPETPGGSQGVPDGAELRRRRLAAGWSQQAVADRIHVSRPTVCSAEIGNRTVAERHLRAYAELLDEIERVAAEILIVSHTHDV